MKKVFGLVFILLLSLSLVACGSGGNSGNGGGSTGGGSDSGAGKNDPVKDDNKKKVDLKIGLPGSYDVTDKEIIDGFIESHPHINVTIDESPWGDFVQKITAQVAGGNPPDVWFQENAVILGYGHRGAAEDLTPYIEENLNTDEYSPQLFAAQTEDGVWGVPHGLNPATIIYNKKMFDDRNIPYPTDDWTYEEMLDIAREFSKEDGVFGLGVNAAITTGWFPWSTIYGGGILDEEKRNAIVTDPKTIQALKAWVGTIEEGIAPPVEVTQAAGGTRPMMEDNKLAMDMMQYSTQKIMADKHPSLDYDAVQMPIGYDGSRVMPLVTNSWLIHSRSKQEAKDAAWEFLQYYLGEEAQEILAKSGASLPVKLSAMDKLDTEAKPQNKAAFVDGVNESGRTTDENHSWQEWRMEAQPIFKEMHELNISVEEGAAQIQEKIQKVLDDAN